LYLYGSQVTGDFNTERSDIDVLAALSGDVNDQEADDLRKMHDDFADKHARWAGRIEAQYLSVAALQTFKIQTSKMAVISPGEPFHIIEAGNEYSISWYVVQEHSITLYGPPPQTLIEPMSKGEFIDTVADHAIQWSEWIQTTSKLPPSQAYAIFTICRALYSYEHGEQV
jgi:hypothetical protein